MGKIEKLKETVKEIKEANIQLCPSCSSVIYNKTSETYLKCPNCETKIRNLNSEFNGQGLA